MQAPLPVSSFTPLLNLSSSQRRGTKHQAFLSLVSRNSTSPTSPQHQPPILSTILRSAWSLPCSPAIKETYWRLTLDCIPGANYHPWTCPCSATPHTPRSSRLHTFWSCPIAVAIRNEITSSLPPGTTLSLASLWLMSSPAPLLHPAAWSLTCLAALDAMEQGRRCLWKAARHTVPLPPNPLQLAITLAISTFWSSLQETALARPYWLFPRLSPSHPFLHPSPEDNRLMIVLPPSSD
jgi:hypothetical protein